MAAGVGARVGAGVGGGRVSPGPGGRGRGLARGLAKVIGQADPLGVAQVGQRHEGIVDAEAVLDDEPAAKGPAFKAPRGPRGGDIEGIARSQRQEVVERVLHAQVHAVRAACQRLAREGEQPLVVRALSHIRGDACPEALRQLLPVHLRAKVGVSGADAQERGEAPQHTGIACECVQVCAGHLLAVDLGRQAQREAQRAPDAPAQARSVGPRRIVTSASAGRIMAVKGSVILIIHRQAQSIAISQRHPEHSDLLSGAHQPRFMVKGYLGPLKGGKPSRVPEERGRAFSDADIGRAHGDGPRRARLLYGGKSETRGRQQILGCPKACRKEGAQDQPDQNSLRHTASLVDDRSSGNLTAIGRKLSIYSKGQE